MGKRRVTVQYNALEVINLRLGSSAVNELRTETHNAIGFIGTRQPGICLCRADRNSRIDQYKMIWILELILLVFQRIDFVAPADPNRPPAKSEERDVRAK